MTAKRSDARKGNDSTGTRVTDLDDPEANEELLREFTREQLHPAVDDLTVAPVIGSIDSGAAFVEYLLRAAEMGELAQSALERSDSLDSLDETEREVLEHAYQALFSAAGYTKSGKEHQERKLDSLVTDIERLVDATEEIGGEPDVNVPETPETHPDDTYWKKVSGKTHAMVSGGLTHINFGSQNQEAESNIEILEFSPDSDTIPVATRTEATVEDTDLTLSSTMYLTPDQAEQFADALAECAQDLREETDER
jgi:hypothetical protein